MDSYKGQNPFRHLVRGIGDYSGYPYPISLPTISEVNAILEISSYDTAPWGMASPLEKSFRNALEGFLPPKLEAQTMHNIVHDWVAGAFTFQGKSYVGSMEPLDVYLQSAFGLTAFRPSF